MFATRFFVAAMLLLALAPLAAALPPLPGSIPDQLPVDPNNPLPSDMVCEEDGQIYLRHCSFFYGGPGDALWDAACLAHGTVCYLYGRT
jgi:hypothetical protein